MNRSFFILAIIALVFLNSCAQMEERRPGQSNPYESATFPETTLECIYIKTLYDWKALDPYRLIVWAPRKKPYLLELEIPCGEMRFVQKISFTSKDGRLCAFGKDSVVVPGPIPKECSIGSIRALTEGDLARLLEKQELTETEPRPQPDESK